MLKSVHYYIHRGKDMSWTTPGQGYLKMWNEAGDLESVKKKAEEKKLEKEVADKKAKEK